MGHLTHQVDRKHLDRYVKRGDMDDTEATDHLARMRHGIDAWSARAARRRPVDAVVAG